MLRSRPAPPSSTLPAVHSRRASGIDRTARSVGRWSSFPVARQRLRAYLLLFLTLLSTARVEAADDAEAAVRPTRSEPVPYRTDRLNLRDDAAGRLEAVLIDLARRRDGRRLIDRLLDSGFITVLVSTRLRPLQAGLWGPIFSRGRAVGATLYLDLVQIRRIDLDPTGIETLAHELRHQVDAARAFGNNGDWRAIHRAALSGDRTGAAQRYARRLNDRPPDLDEAEAGAWLEPRLNRLDSPASHLVAALPRSSASE